MLLPMHYFILYYGRVIFRVCVCVHHIFFIHFSAHGHLVCFHVLAILSCTAMNPGVACIFLNEFLSHKDNLSKRHIELSKSPLTCPRILRCLRDHVLSLSLNSHLKIFVYVSGILNQHSYGMQSDYFVLHSLLNLFSMGLDFPLLKMETPLPN